MPTKLIKPNIGTCIILVNPKGEVLLGRRLGKIWPGHFGLPGGSLETGEQIVESAQKELREETDMSLSELTYFMVILDHQKPPVNEFVNFVFIVRGFSQTPVLMEPSKCAGWKWYSPGNLPQPIVPSHLTALNRLFSDPDKNNLNFQEITTY